MELRLSIIVPMLNEAAYIEGTLRALQPLRSEGHEVIVADGGSDDGSRLLAEPLADHLLRMEGSRARVMNAATDLANGDVLLFLHADTLLPPDTPACVTQALSAANRVWGRFDIHLSGGSYGFRLIERLMNWRSCATGIATGDQAMFMTRLAYEQAGRFPDYPLMEDIALSRALRQLTRPACVRAEVIVSSRRWQHYGVVRTVLLMWWLRLGYFLGVDTVVLAQHYHRSDVPSGARSQSDTKPAND